ncbi:MAG TPA: ATP-dependent zinc metalloprotease FtsH [Longimicrobiales bacterium]|nr:ATP-dependent zinc metalloprotease FtsH [Longimicrobiales bacterium]
MKDERRSQAEDRRRSDRRRNDRRRGSPPVMQDRRTRFSLLYFFIVVAFVLGLNYMLGQGASERLPYSELKARIAAGQIERVVIGPQQMRAEPNDSLLAAGAPDVWTTTVSPQGDDELIPLLESTGTEHEFTSAGVFTQLLGWLLPLGLLIVFWIWMMRRINPAQSVMTVGKNRARIMGEEGTGVTFGDVAGADEAKQELVEVVEFLKTPEKFARLGAKIPKGVLLVGPPGTGKTLLARAVAGEADVTFFSISGSEFVEMFVGVGAARVRDLFEQAKQRAPCIVFIDELDALGKQRGGGGPMGGHDEREQTLNQLLVEMDGFDPRTGVIIMAATNRPEILDQALLRPGRFDRQVVVDRPDMAGRLAILAVHSAQIRLGDDVELLTVARRTPGFVGADLANLLNEAALLAAREDKDQVEMVDIEHAIDRIIAGLEKKNRLVHETEREIVAYHEAGHAIVAERAEHADPVHKISIIPRGVAALGYTQQLPTDERYLIQRPELYDRIAVLLAGRAAEEVVFGEISTGAGNDLERATDIARRMVAELGMSSRIGPVNLMRRQGTFLEQDGSGRGDYSEATAQIIDSEVQRLLVEGYNRAIEVLKKDRAILEQLARMLLEKEVVERAELRELMGVPANVNGDGARPEVGHVPATTLE